MIRINLLPQDLQAPKAPVAMALPIGGAFTILALVMIPMTLSMRSSRASLQRQAADLQNELTRYLPVTQQVDALEKARALLQARKNLVLQLEDQRLQYPQFFDVFVKEIPPNVWLTSMNTNQKPDGTTTVDLDVVALDNYVIADFIANLQAKPIFTDVELGTISASQSVTGTTLSFHLRTIYHPQGTHATIAAKRP